MMDLFSAAGVAAATQRIHQLTAATRPLWGKMSVDQMLAHVNVPYEMVYEPGKHPRPRGLMKWMLRTFVKNNVVNEVPYKRNMRTAPAFLISGNRDFESEKTRLIDYLERTRQLGAGHFDGRSSHSFGPLSVTQWNHMFAKHLDHHLSQFGV